MSTKDKGGEERREVQKVIYRLLTAGPLQYEIDWSTDALGRARGLLEQLKGDYPDNVIEEALARIMQFPPDIREQRVGYMTDLLSALAKDVNFENLRQAAEEVFPDFMKDTLKAPLYLRPAQRFEFTVGSKLQKIEANAPGQFVSSPDRIEYTVTDKGNVTIANDAGTGPAQTTTKTTKEVVPGDKLVMMSNKDVFLVNFKK